MCSLATYKDHNNTRSEVNTPQSLSSRSVLVYPILHHAAGIVRFIEHFIANEEE